MPDRQTRHAVLPTPLHDEAARQHFVFSLAHYVRSDVSPGNRDIYEHEVRPAFERANGRAPTSLHEVRRAMDDRPFFQMSSELQRASQEMLWDSVLDSIERQLPTMISTAKNVRRGKTRGSLTLDSALPIPAYVGDNHHHAMPGGYAEERAPDDVSAGALYDRGAYIYVDGNFGPLMDGIGRGVVLYIKHKFPDFQPKRILDMGCTAGNGTLPLADIYPDAEIHAIDVSAACLRYGHARAESLGKAIHFSQQNAEHTKFPDGHFDLIVSGALLHEMAHSAVLNLIGECRRLLRPGGLMVHSEQPPYRGVEVYQQWVRDWDCRNNNEPFWTRIHSMNLPEEAVKAGFSADKVFEDRGYAPSVAAQVTAAVAADKVMGSPRGARRHYLFCAFK
ncbi:MAG: class I SAM-dependent methyltransferase [Alphaproteobacteria bacterium]|nr:class I SAM-dependent methyltransferase [Alphaproteobacteria bacterium]